MAVTIPIKTLAPEILRYSRVRGELRITGHRAGSRWPKRGGSSVSEIGREDLRNTESAGDFRGIVDNIAAGIAVLCMRDGAITLLAANPALSALVGVSQSGMHGNILEELFRRVHPADVEVAKAAVNALFSERHGAVCVYRTRNEKTRKYIWLHAVGRSVVQADGTQIAYISYTDVSVQKEAESALRRSRQSYALAVQSANLLVWEYDIKTRCAVCQGESFARAGLPNVIEDVPYSLLDHVLEKDRAKLLLMYADLESGGKTADSEIWYRREPTAEPRCARTSYSVVFDNRGRPVKAYGILQDITLQKLEEKKYARMVQRMLTISSRSLYTACLDLTRGSRENAYGLVPDTAAAEDGGTADEFFSSAAQRVADPKAAEAFRAVFNRRALMRAFFSGQSECRQTYLRRMENEKNTWVEARVTMAKNPETGNIEAVFCIIDRSEKIKGELLVQRLTNEEYDFIALINVEKRQLRLINIKSGGFSLLEQGVNFTEAEIVQNTIGTTIAPEDQKRYLENISLESILNHLKKEKTYAFSYTYICAGGARRRKQNRYSWLDDTHEEILLLRTDVTIAYQRDREYFQLLQAALRSAERKSWMQNGSLESLGYSLRTPLDDIVETTRLARGAGSKGELDRCLRQADTAAARLRSMLDDILELAALELRNTVLTRGSFPVRPFVYDVIGAVREDAAQKGVRFTVDSSAWSMRQIYADRANLLKVLTTLLCKAVQMSKPGGQVEWVMESFTPVADGADCRFLVREHGAGIAKERIPHLFEPFWREGRSVDRETADFVRGLAVVKRLTEMMGGALWAEGGGEQGVLFTLLFRFAEPALETSAPRTSAAAAKKLCGRKILVCEDNPGYLALVQAMLERQGALVTCADDGEKGVRVFNASKETEYDAILMDLTMPRMNGPAAARAIRSLTRSDARTVPIIAMAADPENENMELLRDSGMNACLGKPFESEELCSILAVNLHGEREAQ